MALRQSGLLLFKKINDNKKNPFKSVFDLYPITGGLISSALDFLRDNTFIENNITWAEIRNYQFPDYSGLYRYIYEYNSMGYPALVRISSKRDSNPIKKTKGIFLYTN